MSTKKKIEKITIDINNYKESEEEYKERVSNPLFWFFKRRRIKDSKKKYKRPAPGSRPSCV